MEKLVEDIILHTKNNDAYILTEETAKWHELNAVANIDNDSFNVTTNDTLVELERELSVVGLTADYRKFKDPITFRDLPSDKLYHYLFIGKQA